MCVRPCVSASVRICQDHTLYNNAWISKQFGIVVALEEEKCLLKHVFREVEGQGHRDQIKVKWSYIDIVRAITCTFLHGFQNNFAQLLSLRRKSAI